MSNKNYLILALLLAGLGGLIKNNSSPRPTADITNQNTSPVSDVKIDWKQKTFASKKETTDDLATNANSPSIRDSSKPENEIKKEIAIENSALSEVEPTNTNADLIATGEFSDQVNLAIESDDCKESCVSNADVNSPAAGEFADQINADVIFKQAMLKNPELQEEIKLTEISVNSQPPTELGAYTPPPSQ